MDLTQKFREFGQKISWVFSFSRALPLFMYFGDVCIVTIPAENRQQKYAEAVSAGIYGA